MAVNSLPTYDPFYDPRLAWDSVQWQDDPANVPFQYGEQNPEAAWTRRLSEMGLGGTDPKAAFARSLYGRFREGHQATQTNAPGYYWQTYLTNMLNPGKLDTLWKEQSPTQRGENIATWAPNARWLRRA
jgi:hypothetical protein